MFAIEINQENLALIKSQVPALAYAMHAIERFVQNKNTWYLVSGYVSNMTGSLLDWAVLPEYMLVKRFNFNPDVICHDWDQIVRKEN